MSNHSLLTTVTTKVLLPLVVTLPLQGWGASGSYNSNTTRLLASGCTTCHGPLPAPGLVALSSLPAAELLQRLRAFRQGERPGTLMPQLLQAYDDNDLQALAHHWGQRP